jgi:nucleotide-binding universal stress UspA family protein
VAAVRRIVVGVHGSLGSLQALRYATQEAKDREVPMVVVTAWLPPGGDLAERRHPSPYLRRIWREAAWERLWAAFDDGLGGMPADVQVRPHVVRGESGPVLVDTASEPGDLLVIGTGRRGWLSRLRSSVTRYCLAHAKCPVLSVPPSALVEELGRRRRPWTLRRHELVPGQSHPAPLRQSRGTTQPRQPMRLAGCSMLSIDYSE